MMVGLLANSMIGRCNMPEQNSEQWYYEAGGETCGPLSREALQKLIDSGQLTNDTPVIRDGMKTWLPVGSLAGLRSESSSETSSQRTAEGSPIGGPAGAKQKRQSIFVYLGLVAVAAMLAGVGGWFAHSLFSEPSSAPITQTPTNTEGTAEGKLVTENKVKVTHVGDEQSITTTDTLTRTDAPPQTSENNLSETGNSNIASRDVSPTIVSPDIVSSVTASKPSQQQDTTQNVAFSDNNGTELLVLFQLLEIDRRPKLSMLGSVIEQNIQYRILSELRVGPADTKGNREVLQTVKETQLVKADAMSKTMFEDALKRLVGSEFSYTLNSRNEVIAMHPPDDGKKFGEIEPAGAKGLLMTSVMDADGWKELAELSFFTPDVEPTETQTWTRQMTHNFEPLGSWSGVTTFSPRGTEKSVTKIDYEHDLNYKPPAKGAVAAGGLSLNVKNAAFRAETAQGVIYYDHALGRVRTAEEMFHVKGQIAADALGQIVTIPVEEEQTFTLHLTDQYPGTQTPVPSQ